MSTLDLHQRIHAVRATLDHACAILVLVPAGPTRTAEVRAELDDAYENLHVLLASLDVGRG